MTSPQSQTCVIPFCSRPDQLSQHLYFFLLWIGQAWNQTPLTLPAWFSQQIVINTFLCSEYQSAAQCNVWRHEHGGHVCEILSHINRNAWFLGLFRRQSCKITQCILVIICPFAGMYRKPLKCHEIKYLLLLLAYNLQSVTVGHNFTDNTGTRKRVRRNSGISREVTTGGKHVRHICTQILTRHYTYQSVLHPG